MIKILTFSVSILWRLPIPHQLPDWIHSIILLGLFVMCSQWMVTTANGPCGLHVQWLVVKVSWPGNDSVPIPHLPSAVKTARTLDPITRKPAASSWTVEVKNMAVFLALYARLGLEGYMNALSFQLTVRVECGLNGLTVLTHVEAAFNCVNAIALRPSTWKICSVITTRKKAGCADQSHVPVSHI